MLIQLSTGLLIMTDITKLQFEVVESNDGVNLLSENVPYECLLDLVGTVENSGGTALVTIMGTNVQYKSTFFKGGYYLLSNAYNHSDEYPSFFKL